MTGAADPKPASSRRLERTPSDRVASARFKEVVLFLDRSCLVGDDCDGPLQAHHVVGQQELRKAGLHELLWDPRNGMAVCERHHRRHTNAAERLAPGCLPGRCIAFAEEHGFGDYMTRYYTPSL